MLCLTPRLKAVSDMLFIGAPYADIGTDHAYLPAYLVLSGKKEKAIACDIGVKPLENARKTLVQYDLTEKILLRVSNGLKSVSAGEVREVSICGMGGELISQILENAPWIKCSGFHLVLQPQTHTEDVRKFLCLNGFSIKREVVVLDSGRLYCCIDALQTGAPAVTDTGFYYFGLLSENNPLEKEFIHKQLMRVKKRLGALEKVCRFPHEQELLRDVVLYYERNVKNDSR